MLGQRYLKLATSARRGVKSTRKLGAPLPRRRPGDISVRIALRLCGIWHVLRTRSAFVTQRTFGPSRGGGMEWMVLRKAPRWCGTIYGKRATRLACLAGCTPSAGMKGTKRGIFFVADAVFGRASVPLSWQTANINAWWLCAVKRLWRVLHIRALTLKRLYSI